MTTVNANIQNLLEQIKQGRLNKDSDNQLEFKQGLLQSLKTCSKDKQVAKVESRYKQLPRFNLGIILRALQFSNKEFAEVKALE